MGVWSSADQVWSGNVTLSVCIHRVQVRSEGEGVLIEGESHPPKFTGQGEKRETMKEESQGSVES